jgi:hypothetical protein
LTLTVGLEHTAIRISAVRRRFKETYGRIMQTTAGRKKMTEQKTYPTFGHTVFDGGLTRGMKSALLYIYEDMRNMREELSRRDFTTRGKNDVTRRELLPKLPEEHDQACREHRGSKAISTDTGTTPKGPLSSEITRSRTEGHESSPNGYTPQWYFPYNSETLLKREDLENVLNTTNQNQHQITVERKHNCHSIRVDGWIGTRPCLVTVDTGSCWTVLRPDIAEGLPERNITTATSLRGISGLGIPVIKEVLVTLTLHNCCITTWALVANVTDEFTLGHDVMWDLGVVLDLSRQVLRIAGQDVPLKRSEFYPYTTSNGEEPRSRS